MWNRLVFVVMLVIAVVLLPRVYDTVEAARDVFPIDDGAVVLLHLDPVSWLRAAFVVAHGCVAWLVVLIWRRQATLPVKIIALILVGELTTIYLVTLLFWQAGVEVGLY